MKTGMDIGDRNRPIVEGTVGSKFSSQFHSIHTLMKDLPDIDAMLSDPEANYDAIRRLASNKPTVCALNIVLSKRVMKDVKMFGPSVALMERVDEERATAFVRLACMTNEKVTDTPEYGEFVAKHQHMFF